MTARLAPYGSVDHMRSVSKVGDKNKTPQSLAARMPSPEIIAKVGVKGLSTQSLAARMPSLEIAAKVGISAIGGTRTRRVVRRNVQG
jgi:hypothetical protein